jgi:hypothetical protein
MTITPPAATKAHGKKLKTTQPLLNEISSYLGFGKRGRFNAASHKSLTFRLAACLSEGLRFRPSVLFNSYFNAGVRPLCQPKKMCS